jgi:hypothetical protein
MNRRQFLQRGIVGGVVLAGAALFVYPSRERPSDGFTLKALSPRAFSILTAFAGRVVPHVADPRTIAAGVDTSLAYVTPDSVVDLERVLLLFDNALAALIFDGRARPFSRLDAAAQDQVLAAWRDSRITVRRSGYQALRRLCLGACYTDEGEQRAIGYSGPRRVPGLSYDDSTWGVPK